MSATNNTVTAPPPPGQKHRFIVSSAEEAVRVIQQRMGPTAKVLSVKQVAGDGLKRFLTSPKLEVIAWIPPESSAQPKPETRVFSQSGDEIQETDFRPKPSVAPIPPMANEPAAAAKEVQVTQKTTSPSEGLSGRTRESIRLRRILDRIGFDEVLLETLSGPGAYERLTEMPMDEALAELRQAVVRACQREDQRVTGNRIAFLGTPGSGKTTSLCKWLTREVLINGKQVEVLRLDVDSPHFGDGLDAFCEAMGVPCHRDRGQAPMMDEGVTLLVDIPGCELNDYRENIKLRRRLDDLGVDTRVLVLNAAYENSIIQAILRQAHSLEAQHLIFTHADLLQSWGKLWPFAISRHHPPVLFMGTGPNIASDYNESFTSLLIENTLP